MKIILTIVVRFRRADNPSEYSTTYWVDEIEIEPKQSIRDVIAGQVHKRCRDFPRPMVIELPDVLSISHSIIP